MTPTEARELMARPATVEEKIDGACIGISAPSGRGLRVQNRGRYLEPDEGGQFRAVWPWLTVHEDALVEHLGGHLILFGEWCFARHTASYDALPDWFLGFDVYDRSAEAFLSCERRDPLLRKLGVSKVPTLGHGVFDRSGLLRLMGRSKVGSSESEGIYLRWDDGRWLEARAKVVRAGWVQADEEHWSRRPMRINHLRMESASAKAASLA